ncbi:MAG TPA: glucose-6-phosphate isomerase [Acidobacteriota bacterium]|nr:glucose-6-phosphate isomerase [Acidobacteriota bacterium]
MRKGINRGLVPKIMNRKPEVFTGGRDTSKRIANRLGWVDVVSLMKRRVAGIERVADGAFRAGLRHIVLMGMGGSSLCPEVFGKIFGRHPAVRSFQVLDSTDPATVRAVRRKIDLKKTLFIVASKSGTTVETRSHEAYFFNELRNAGVRVPGRRFVAITDAGSDLERLARRQKYRRTFVNPSDIGGRYSALSYFGLVPAYFVGVDLRRLLDEAAETERLLRDRDDESNPALLLGALMAACAGAGLNKMTLLASRRTAPLVPWLEQLVAESTGKKKTGIVPVEAEPVGKAGHYGADRFFVFLRMTGEKQEPHGRLMKRLIQQRAPVVELVVGDRYDVGSHFLLWEAAVAAAGSLMGINPFDEPNVTESKENTNAILADYTAGGAFPLMEKVARRAGLSSAAARGGRQHGRLDRAEAARSLKRFLAGLRPPQYLAVLCYFKSDRRTKEALAELRRKVCDRTGAAVVRGYGPRYLHSIGQLYKGGPSNGRFIIFVRDRYDHLEIPGRPFDFGRLIAAQAVGDARALSRRRLPVLVMTVGPDPAAGLRTFARAAGRALQ